MRDHPRWIAARRVGAPPWHLYAGVLLLDLAGAALILLALVQIGDSIEDWIWPGGVEWID